MPLLFQPRRKAFSGGSARKGQRGKPEDAAASLPSPSPARLGSWCGPFKSRPRPRPPPGGAGGRRRPLRCWQDGGWRGCCCGARVPASALRAAQVELLLLHLPSRVSAGPRARAVGAARRERGRAERAVEGSGAERPRRGLRGERAASGAERPGAAAQSSGLAGRGQGEGPGSELGAAARRAGVEVERGAPGSGRGRAAPAVGGGQGVGGRVLPVRLGRAAPEFGSPQQKCWARHRRREKLRSPSASWQELGGLAKGCPGFGGWKFWKR